MFENARLYRTDVFFFHMVVNVVWYIQVLGKLEYPKKVHVFL